MPRVSAIMGVDCIPLVPFPAPVTQTSRIIGSLKAPTPQPPSHFALGRAHPRYVTSEVFLFCRHLTDLRLASKNILANFKGALINVNHDLLNFVSITGVTNVN